MTPEQRRKKAAEIWKTLSAVDVTKHVQKRNGLSFLSWSWAWGVMMEHYPECVVSFERFDGLDVMTYPDATCSVHCTVTIGEITRDMWLPVMDFKHKAQPQPTARQISDAKMRAQTKAFAMLGLGHYIFAGEDLPPRDTPETAPAAPRPGVGTKPTRPVNGGSKPAPVDARHQALADSIAAKRTLAELYGDDILKGAIKALQDDLSGSYGKLMSTWVAREEALGGGAHTRPPRADQAQEPQAYSVADTNRS